MPFARGLVLAARNLWSPFFLPTMKVANIVSVPHVTSTAEGRRRCVPWDKAQCRSAPGHAEVYLERSGKYGR
jgi:hypothetical protein